MTFDPILILAMWAAGLAAAAAAVAWWQVARVGFVWLAAGVVALVGVAAFREPLALAGLAATALAAAVARRQRVSAVAFAVGAACFLAVATERDSLLPAVSGALAMGGITAEMLLGHWYLVDPRLPRWALRRLDVAGVVGVLAEIAVAGVDGTLRPPTDIVGLAYLMLAVTTVVLAVMVWFSLDEQGYEGVMAATGLSYLATLTVLGTVFLARAPLERLFGIT